MAMRTNEARRARRIHRRSVEQALTQPNSKARPKVPSGPMNDDTINAITKLRRHGALYRKHGGYWTYQGCSVNVRQAGQHASVETPSWYALTTTIRDVVARGWGKWSADGEAILYVRASAKARETQATESL